MKKKTIFLPLTIICLFYSVSMADEITNPYELYDLGLKLYQSGQCEKGIEYLQKALDNGLSGKKKKEAEDKISKSFGPPISYDFENIHTRHMDALEGNCAACHHSYDKNLKKLVYLQGEETSCDDCHERIQRGSIPSLSVAFRVFCTRCHKERTIKGKAAGPVKWNECP